MADVLPSVPASYVGLWERTLLERNSPGTLTSDRPARVYWMQTATWHADIRIPLERPDFSSVERLEDCDEAQLAFIVGQEAFFGLTKVDGTVCTWLRLHDLRPGTALDIGRMTFAGPDLLFEYGIAEDYLEHWERQPGSVPEDGAGALREGAGGGLILQCGDWAMRIVTRGPAGEGYDPYRPADEIAHEELAWRASLEMTLLERSGSGWTARLSTHPWIEGEAVSGEIVAKTSPKMPEVALP